MTILLKILRLFAPDGVVPILTLEHWKKQLRNQINKYVTTADWFFLVLWGISLVLIGLELLYVIVITAMNLISNVTPILDIGWTVIGLWLVSVIFLFVSIKMWAKSILKRFIRREESSMQAWILFLVSLMFQTLIFILM